jgi:hypothetical protein
MHRTLAVLTALLVSGGPVVAQAFLETFPYADGTVIPGWTERRGDWGISNGQAILLTTPANYNYLTKDGLTYRDSVSEVSIFYEGAISRVQAGGLVSRHYGGPNNTNLIMCAIQDNTPSAAVGFDSLWSYEYGGPGFAVQTNLPLFLSCRARMVTVDNTAITYVDTDLNGTWDVVNTINIGMFLNTGETGLSSALNSPLLRSCAMDDFALFDGVVTGPRTVSVGQTISLSLRGQVSSRVYQAACSLSTNPGILIDSRRIPLSPDALMVASFTLPTVFQNFTGVLDPTGSGTISINVPNLGALVGLTFYAGFVTVVPGAPSGIENVSNDHDITIRP